MDLPGPITVFAPVNAAFDMMTEGHLAYLSSPEVRTKELFSLVTFHYSQKYFLFRVTPNWWSCSGTTLSPRQRLVHPHICTPWSVLVL